MNKLKKILICIIVVVVLLVIGVISYITLALPNVGAAEDIHIAATPQQLARGAYLVNHVSLCTDCHTKRDWSKFAAPGMGSLGGGGEKFDATAGFPGDVTSPNITPYHLKDWTDGEILRAITTGVRKNGDAIFPLMPWPYYSKMSREDLYSIIAYIRTLKPVESSYPKSKLDFPLNIIVHTMPQKATFGVLPSPSDTVKYGAYMVQAAGCRECHSQDKNGAPLPGMEFAGGHNYIVNGDTVSSPNITPDMATGIGAWTQEAFVAHFKAFSDPSKAVHVSRSDFQTLMPWYGYSGMTDGDLKSIYTYLRTLKPVTNKVVKFRPNTLAAK
jgi:mono/diheme cytochrome c family protein